MKVIKNSPPPVVQPPTTYDLTGISQEEMDMLRCFANYVTRVLDHDLALEYDAANRFLNRTVQFAGNTYAPDKCFV